MTEFRGRPLPVWSVGKVLILVFVGLFALLYAMFAFGNFSMVVGHLEQPWPATVIGSDIDSELRWSAVAVGIVTEGVLAALGAAALVKAGALFRRGHSARAGAIACAGTAPLAVFLGLGAAFLDNSVTLFYAALVVPVAATAALVLRRRR